MSMFYVGITHTDWFLQLRNDYRNNRLEKYVNFWTPGTKEFKAIGEGELFLFKLHNNKAKRENGEIVGGAFFSHFEKMGIQDAWKTYGRGNGRESLGAMRLSLKEVRERNHMATSEEEIGCIILENAFFFDRESWITEPENWKKNIVSGKRYSTDEQVGEELYRAVWNNINKDRQ